MHAPQIRGNTVRFYFQTFSACREFSKENERVANRAQFLMEREQEREKMREEREEEKYENWMNQGEQAHAKEQQEMRKFVVIHPHN